MNILLVGRKSRFLRLLVEKLNKEGNRVFLLTEEKGTGGIADRVADRIFETYSFSYNNARIHDVVESIHPDKAVFLGAFDGNFQWNESENRAGVYASGLLNVLRAFTQVSTGRFIYLSSEEVFQGEYSGKVQEDEICAAVTAKGQALAIGEQTCSYYRQLGNDVVTLRLDHLYSIPENPAEARGMCARMCIEAIETGEILVHEEQQAAILYAADAVEFIYQVLAAEHTDSGLYHVSSGEPLPQSSIAELIAKGYGDGVTVTGNPNPCRREPVLSNEKYAKEFGIHIFHKPEKELPAMAEHMRRNAAAFSRVERKPRTVTGRIAGWIHSVLPALIPFIENLICFIPFFMLNNRAVGREYFQNIDFYLLYVLLFAIVYGQQQATFASLLAVAGYCFRQMYQRSGFDVMLDYNTYIWIAQLLILGLAVGYMRDRLHVVEEEEQREVEYLSKQIDDISDINVSNVRVKEILSTQIINQNDSFGKLYEITSSLDQYEPSEVLFYAAEILAKLMGSRDVAIYTVANRSYARLFSATSEKARQLGNSINYQKMDAMYEQIQERKVFINKKMDENYPLMANAIYSEDEMQLILMVWGIPWERMSLGQANMLTVIGYLIQNAVVRANRYLSALEQQRYVEGTNILGEEAFRSLVKAYLTAKEKGLTECALVSVNLNGASMEAAAQTLGGMVRQSDYLGELEQGSMYALLANTNGQDAAFVVKRFEDAGYVCSIQEDILL